VVPRALAFPAVLDYAAATQGGHVLTHPLINPVAAGAVRRCDDWGQGHFGAPRGARTHNGVDIIACADAPVLSPLHAVVVRVAEPYDDDAVLSGLLLRGVGPHAGLEAKLFYVLPDLTLIGQLIAPGQPLGRVQTLQSRYPGITDHVHLELRWHDARVDPATFIPELC
jgi:hypothetical protein